MKRSKLVLSIGPFYERDEDGLINGNAWSIEATKSGEELFVRVRHDDKLVGHVSFQGTERDLKDWMDRVRLGTPYEPYQVLIAKRLRARFRGKIAATSLDLEGKLAGLGVAKVVSTLATPVSRIFIEGA